MTKTKLHALAEREQSIWLDYVHRSLLESNGLQDYIDKGLTGVTSNPAIFSKAITESQAYDDEIQRLALEGKSAQEIYETLAIEDIQRTADLLHPIFERTAGDDGYVSLEVNPHLAHKTQETIEEARRLAAAVDRPNLMIKVPATSEGLLAIQTLTAEGYNINATLMFSLAQYDLVSDAYLSGLEKRAANSYTLQNIASVASFFVSRIDVKVDALLDVLDTRKAQELKGKLGIANAKMAYQHFRQVFHSECWKNLAQQNAHLQRVLFGSTSTKTPDYPDTHYVDNLIGPQTVNTLPPKTLEAFLDHGTVASTLESDLDKARQELDELADLGINLKDVTDELLEEGVQKFTHPYDKLIENIAEKQANFITA